MARLRVEVEVETHSVERDDVVAWAGLDPTDADHGALLVAAAADYVRANPRPDPDAQGGVNVAARQRMALLRRLASGPATRSQLLATMRDAAGYVGGDDWRNRLDELRGRGKRGGGHAPLPIAHDEDRDTYRLTDPFPTLSDSDRRTLGRLKATTADAGDDAARVLLDALAPGVVELREQADTQGSEASGQTTTSSSKASQRSSPRTAASNRR